MPIYKNTNSKLQPIKEKIFKLEKDIQGLVEQNLMELFGIDFVESERVINGLRIDTLGFDPETKSFVIIEYKRGSSFSIVDQGFSYLSLLLNNKADFILEYNEKNKNQLKRTDVDWSQSRIIFVSPGYTTHQINAVNFKNAPFELWEIKQYENNTVALNQIKNDDSQELMPNIEDKPAFKEFKKETKEHSESTLFNNRKKAKNLYDSFKEKITDIYPEIVFDPKSGSVNVKYSDNWRVIVYINAYTDRLRLTFTRSNSKDYQDAQNRLEDASDQKVKNKGQKLTYLHVKKDEDVEYAVNIFQQAYKKFKKEFIEG
jgi:predicted transport protein